MVYTLRFFPLQNAVCFIILSYLVPVLFAFYIHGVLKLKKLFRVQKVKQDLSLFNSHSKEQMRIENGSRWSCKWFCLLCILLHLVLSQHPTPSTQSNQKALDFKLICWKSLTCYNNISYKNVTFNWNMRRKILTMHERLQPQQHTRLEG